MRYLGIDPGLRLTGYGCVDLMDHLGEPVLVEGGVLRLNPKDSLPNRTGLSLNRSSPTCIAHGRQS